MVTREDFADLPALTIGTIGAVKERVKDTPSEASSRTSDVYAGASKCACERCHCQVGPPGGVQRDGKLYCSETCAYDCTEQTCVCVHDRCEEGHCDH